MGLIICIMGVYVPMVSSFRKSKNMVTKNPEFPFTKHHNLPSYISRGQLKVNDISQKDELLHRDYGHIQKYMCKFHISTFTLSYQMPYVVIEKGLVRKSVDF